MGERSGHWDNFYASFFGDSYYAWHEGLDVDALRNLSAEEKQAAAGLLMKALPGGDYRAVVGAGELRLQEALPALQALRESQPPASELRAYAAAALAKISGAEDALEDVLETLSKGESEQERASAAVMLMDFNTPAVLEALYAAMVDRNFFVRISAARAILYLHGQDPETLYQIPDLYNDLQPTDKDDFNTGRPDLCRRAAFMLRDGLRTDWD